MTIEKKRLKSILLSRAEIGLNLFPEQLEFRLVGQSLTENQRILTGNQRVVEFLAVSGMHLVPRNVISHQVIMDAIQTAAGKCERSITTSTKDDVTTYVVAAARPGHDSGAKDSLAPG